MNFELYEMSEEREKRLWNESIIVFDSSALLDLYFLPKQTREKVFDNLFANKLDGRLWIPFHVSYEYYKNRNNVIHKPIAENCKPLKDINLKAIRKSIKGIEDKVLDIKNKTKKEDKYPHLEQGKIDEYIALIKKFNTESESFEKQIIEQIDKAETEIKELIDNDDVFQAIEKYFVIGREFSFEEITQITQEGKHRYEFKIPPGYEDLKEKVGTQIFGDLIIWKQILEYAKETQKPIILICNDIKEDWCYKADGTEKRIKSPREELIKEIFDIAKVEFWMYNLPQFLYMTNEHIAVTPEEKIDDKNILNFSQFLAERSARKVKVRKRVIYEDLTKCEECDGKDGYGNYITSWDEIGLINEYTDSHPNAKFHSAYVGVCDWCNTLHIECPKCHSVTPLSEYVYNEKVECEGGCGLVFYVESNNSYDNYGEYEVYIKDPRLVECEGCGKEFIDSNKTGMCDECENKYNEE